MPKPGDRIELVSTNDPATKLRPGSRGTVSDFPVDDIGTLNIKWDDGSTLGLNSKFGDRWRVIEKEEA